MDEAGDELERLLACLQRELVEDAGVTWTEPTPVPGTTVIVQFNEDTLPSAESRTQQALDTCREDWSRFLGFAATPGP